MKLLKKAVLLAGLPGLAGLMASCQTTPADVTSAVTCDKCKTVWVQRPVQVGGSSGKGGYYALRATKTMVCPDCESNIATFVRTGSLKHACSHCGGTMNHCTVH